MPCITEESQQHVRLSLGLGKFQGAFEPFGPFGGALLHVTVVSWASLQKAVYIRVWCLVSPYTTHIQP